MELYQDSFPYYPEYAVQIGKLLKAGEKRDFEAVLLLAEGSKSWVMGFSPALYFPDLGYAYLDYLVSDPARKSRGIGETLGTLCLPMLLIQEGGYSLPNLKAGSRSFLTGISEV